MPDKLRPCPFCGKYLEFFGHSDDLPEEQVTETYRHPYSDIEKQCALGGLLFKFRTWQHRPLEDDLLAACKAALEHLGQASFDYSNGNTDSTGTIDEGNVRGWQYHKELMDKLRAAIAKAEGKG